MRLGMWEVILMVLVVLIFFGAKRVPELMRSMGRGLQEFKKGLAGKDENKES